MNFQLIRISILAALGWMVAAGPLGASPEEARELLGRWVETQRLQAEEESQWRQQEAFLRQSLELLREESGLLEKRLATLRESAAGQIDRREALEAENEALRDAADRFRAALDGIGAETAAFARFFPAPLAERVRSQLERLESDRDNVSLPRRFQALLGILGEANRFNQSVTVARQTIDRADGGGVEVNVLYLGLAHAWFVNDTGDFAGRGRPAEGAWEWTPDPAMAEPVRRAIAIHENRRPAETVTLPFELTRLP